MPFYVPCIPFILLKVEKKFREADKDKSNSVSPDELAIYFKYVVLTNDVTQKRPETNTPDLTPSYPLAPRI